MSSVADSPRSLEQWQRQLEATFEEIQTARMRGVPVVNSALSVSAEVFTRWESCYLGVMITPWFMNIMLLPATERTREQFAGKQIGQKQNHFFPCGSFEFTVGMEPALGHFQSCSLFSPMFDFRDQQAALDTARAVLVELMNADNLEPLDPGGNRIGRQSTDDDPSQDVGSPEQDGSAAPQHAAPPTAPGALSRRQLLLGGRK